MMEARRHQRWAVMGICTHGTCNYICASNEKFHNFLSKGGLPTTNGGWGLLMISRRLTRSRRHLVIGWFPVEVQGHWSPAIFFSYAFRDSYRGPVPGFVGLRPGILLQGLLPSPMGAMPGTQGPTGGRPPPQTEGHPDSRLRLYITQRSVCVHSARAK